MNTYLFTWNPQKWNWDDQENLIAQLPTKKPSRKWATVSTKNIGIGDKFILIKIGGIPKNEKGIIGIGSITSFPFKDKDFLKSDKIRNFVTLEFDQLSEKPFISLNELEHQYSYHNQKWTPEGSGILIKDNTLANEIFTKVLTLIESNISQPIFKKKIFFPIIADEIDLALIKKQSINRDEIIQILLEKYQTTFEKIVKNSDKTVLFIAQNMVDWFSAELTKQSDIVAEWQNKYFRNKIRVNGRAITNYSLALNTTQDEFFEKNNTNYTEGSVKQITVNAYERNSQARKKCLEHWKYSCKCCNFNFELTYGELGKEFIHVHHIKPLSEIKAEYELNPITDLIPVCANCHAMLHRKNPPLTIEDLKNLLAR